MRRYIGRKQSPDANVRFPPSLKFNMQTEMRKSTVLVVDDELHILVIVKTMLETAGLDIITTDDPQQALAIVEQRKNQIAFVLSDVRMPGMDGRQLLRRVVEVSPGTGVALMSGYAGRIVPRIEYSDYQQAIPIKHSGCSYSGTTGAPHETGGRHAGTCRENDAAHGGNRGHRCPQVKKRNITR